MNPKPLSPATIRRRRAKLLAGLARYRRVLLSDAAAGELQLAYLRSRCPHASVTTHTDPSGDDGPTRVCEDCGAEIGREQA